MGAIWSILLLPRLIMQVLTFYNDYELFTLKCRVLVGAAAASDCGDHRTRKGRPTRPACCQRR